MKRLILVGGPMGIGKSAVCSELAGRLQPSVYLDGDWCWNMRPFSVTEETRAMVLDNICALLGRFLTCPELEYVIFGWVMHQQEIIDSICARLPLEGVEVSCFSLTASPRVLRYRLVQDIAQGKRSGDIISRSLAYLPLYDQLNTQKMNTDHATARQVATRILRVMEGQGA